MNPTAAYDELLRRVRERALLGSCAALLEWDEETYMPERAVASRGEQRALLAGLLHDRATDPALGDLLAQLADSPLAQDTESPEAVNIRELRRDYGRATRIPRDLVAELARTAARAHSEWIVARQQADFARFCPWLERIVALKREEAQAIGYADEPYDALLDDYEPGATAREVGALLDALRAELVPLVAAIGASPRRPPTAIIHRQFPIDRQRAFGQRVSAAVGFDFTGGRMDTSTHPFCTGIAAGDTRLTARYRADDFSEGIFGILHETGHGLYEQGLDPEYHGTPMGETTSLGVHESQSRTWENHVGRSRAFWEYFLPKAREVFPESLHDASVDELYFAVNAVAPSFIRVRADEVTYNLHVIARFEIERALVRGDLSAADVPAAWNDAYRRYLGITPPDDAQGCLQDGHWSSGLIGYFPTYTLGEVFGAQLFAAASAAIGDLPRAFATGDFRPLLHWLREHVHRHGRRWPSKELVERATGEPPNHAALIGALRRKYGELYGM